MSVCSITINRYIIKVHKTLTKCFYYPKSFIQYLKRLTTFPYLTFFLVSQFKHKSSYLYI